MNHDLKELIHVIKTHKIKLPSGEAIIEKYTIYDMNFDLRDCRIKELTIITTPNTDFAILNDLLKNIKFDYLILYIYKLSLIHI